MTPQQAAKLAAEASERVSEYVARAKRGKEAFPSLVLRALKQARYDPQNLGHSGLASTGVLPLHLADPPLPGPRRATARCCARSAQPTSPLPEDIAASPSTARCRSARRRDVEYRADDIVPRVAARGRLFERGWEEPFAGEITGLIGSGLFVRFGDVFEGYLPARRLPGDYYEIDATRTGSSAGVAVGRSGSATRSTVRVEEIRKNEGKVELALAG